jgi:hypothetical protein
MRLPPPALATIVALSIGASSTTAKATGSLYLGWDDCPLGASAAQDRSIPCDVDSGENDLIVSFSVPQAVDSVLALEITLDLQHALPTLPAWWQFGPSTCRAGALQADGDFGGLTSCDAVWTGSETGGLQVYAVGEPRGGLNQARMRVALAVVMANRVHLSANTIYYAARISIDNANTTGPQACAGCAEPACVVLNTILVGRPPGSPSGNLLVESPGTAGSNWATWQGGIGADCQAVPVRRRTWGQVKSLYR